MKLSIEERLLAKRIINNETNCWESTLATIGNGYCQMSVNIDGSNRKELVHRIAYSIWKDKSLAELKELFQNGIEILHSCDNRICFNPEHLSLGTRKENLEDMTKKGNRKGNNFNKKECKRGHSLADENSYYLNRNGNKNCKLCTKIRNANRYRVI